MERDTDIRTGIRRGLPLVLPTLALGVSFGVLAEPVMGPVAPIVMSFVVFSGGAQFAALSVLVSGGAAGAAIGVFASGLMDDPEALGLDAIFPAFYLTLLVGELRNHGRDAWAVVALACALTLALMPFAPAGLPVIAASAAALLGLRRA